jgi:hypothetical protein
MIMLNACKCLNNTRMKLLSTICHDSTANPDRPIGRVRNDIRQHYLVYRFFLSVLTPTIEESHVQSVSS